MGFEFFKVYAKRPFGPASWRRTRFAPALLWNYLKIAQRKIKRQKGYSVINIAGLASFLAEKRTKEIGIRKILGAPDSGLILLQTREFSKWILVSGLVAGPAAFHAAGRWLRGFAYHINPSAGIFLAAVFATLWVALLAVGFQSVRAARANPVESLRPE